MKTEEIAKQYDVPEVIELKTRRGNVETTLNLDDAVIFEDGIVMFIYNINAKYSYRMIGLKQIEAVDFSEGPMIYLGQRLGNMKVEIINSNRITLTKL